jgi:nucleoside-diphosphate-sugar epimerase
MSSMVLRPAAIYGPGRGVHVSISENRYRLIGDGKNFVSRIHVDDLAAHVEEALLSDISGAWPVADEHPCTSREIAEYCAGILGVPLPGSVPAGEVHRTRRADRRVDGSAIRRALGIELLYPTYRDGIQANFTNP